MNSYFNSRQYVAPSEIVAVKSLQSHCARIGLYAGEIDGLWGNMTQSSVEQTISKYGIVYSFPVIPAEKGYAGKLSLMFRLIPGFQNNKR